MTTISGLFSLNGDTESFVYADFGLIDGGDGDIGDVVLDISILLLLLLFSISILFL
jgi:hypothetical protein